MSDYSKYQRWFKSGRSNISDEKCEVMDLLHDTPHAGRRPYGSFFFDWGVYFPFLEQCTRLKKFQYLQVSDRVLESVSLNSAIKLSVENILKEEDTAKNESEVDLVAKGELYQKLMEKERKRAVQILNGMRSQLSDLFLRITSWILYNLLPRFLSGVVTNAKQIKMLKATTEKAEGIPLIFLPLHRSHLDYIIISFILLNNDIRSPIVVAGDNLKIPIFGFLLRRLGAFFIKRKIDPVVGKKDILYRTVLQSYTQHILEAGHNLEFFIEGGRTRTGKPSMPKSGILSVIVNAFMDGAIKDALLVPVSVNYERLVDGNFITEQMGQRKKPETLFSALSGIWKALNSKYGLMRIDFNYPFSIKELVNTYNDMALIEGSTIYKPATNISVHHNVSSSSLYGTDVVNESHRKLVESIARQVVYDCVVATSVMSTNAVAFLFLTRFRHGTTEEILAKELDVLRRKLYGRKDIAFSGESYQIIRYAVDLLGKSLVTKVQHENTYMLKPNIDLPHVIELTYYANGLAPHFALQSIIVTELYCLSRRENAVTRKRLKEECTIHCEILRYEFVFCKPTQSLDQLIEEAIDSLRDEDILILPESNDYNELEMHSRRIAAFVENNMWDDEDRMNDVEVNDDVRLATNKNEEIEAYLSILAPYSYTYLVVVNMLNDLIGNSILETDFSRNCITELKRGIETGMYPYSESVSMESIKNCLKLLEKWEVLRISSTHGVRLLGLEPTYDNVEGLSSLKEKFQNIVPNLQYFNCH